MENRLSKASRVSEGKIEKKVMVEKLETAIRHYAKRQMTWFKRNKEIRWFKPEEYKKIERFAKSRLLA